MSNHRYTGFTLVELIITIVVIAILAVTALPKFIGSSGTDALLVQDQMLSVLRRMQIQAMQQTNTNCHSLQLTASQLAPTGCTTLTDGLSVVLPSNSMLSFSPAGIITFDSLGRLTPAGTPPAVTILTISSSGVPTVNLCIESEGYIHPC